MMSVFCAKCGAEFRAPDKGFRKALKAHGWTSFVIAFDEWWRCWRCGEHKPAANGNR